MKLSKIFPAILAACALMAPAAKATDFYLNDGSVVSGFINNQSLKNDSVVLLEVTKGCVITPEKYAQISEKEFIKESKLNAQWINWANENNGWDMEGNTRGLYFASVRDTRLNHTFKNVHLLGTGSKVKFMFMDQSPVNIALNPKDIVKRVNKPRNPLTLSGEKRRYHLNNKDIEGQLIEINSDGTYTVLDENGMMHSFDKKNILSMEIFALNPDQPFNEQFEYIDEIETSDNRIHSGFIVYQDFKDGAIRIREEEKPIKLKEITTFKKRVNNNKRILKDVDLAKGQLMFNDVVTNKWLNVAEFDQNIIVEPAVLPDSLWIRVPKDSNKLYVFANFRDGENASQWELVKLKQISIKENFNMGQEAAVFDYLKSRLGEQVAKKYLSGKKELKAYGFTYADIVNNSISSVESPKSRNGITKITFSSVNTGEYVLYNKTTKKAIILDIK